MPTKYSKILKKIAIFAEKRLIMEELKSTMDIKIEKFLEQAKLGYEVIDEKNDGKTMRLTGKALVGAEHNELTVGALRQLGDHKYADVRRLRCIRGKLNIPRRNVLSSQRNVYHAEICANAMHMRIKLLNNRVIYQNILGG